jgi:molecular chaperone GrpE
MDDFDRALLHIGETSDDVANGLKLMHQRFNNILHSSGVSSFESEGKPFDPTVHEAVAVIDGEAKDSGTVYAEYQRGYLMNGELLRPARVAVMK